jgi:thiosulfate reductase cytochrome b subunit
VEAALALHNDPGVASAIAWHFAAMWLLALSYFAFMLWNIISGHFRRDFLPVGPASFWRDFIAAARFRLDHRLGEYNAVQRVAYWGVLGAVAMMLLSGVAIWKPVQSYPLETLFGGFQGARIVHFVFMTAIALFIVIHVTLVILVPKTFIAMTLGRATAKPHRGDG